MQNRLFDIKYGFLKVEPTINALNKQQSLLQQYDGTELLEKMSGEDLSQIIYHSEKVALCCREALESKEQQEPIPKADFASCDNIPVSIEYDGQLLRIRTPITLRRMYGGNYTKENYMLVNYICAALNRYQKQHGSLYMKMDYPFVMIIKRKTIKYSASSICDNDNIENGRIANAIFHALGHSDNALVADVYSCYRQCEKQQECGTEFILMPRNELAEHLEEII